MVIDSICNVYCIGGEWIGEPDRLKLTISSEESDLQHSQKQTLREFHLKRLFCYEI